MPVLPHFYKKFLPGAGIKKNKTKNSIRISKYYTDQADLYIKKETRNN